MGRRSYGTTTSVCFRNICKPGPEPNGEGRPTTVAEVRRTAEPEIKSAEAKLADLKRMRVIAVSLLGVMTCIFVATSVATVDWPWLPYARAFAEAGMVGACAAWFAVVALFRHPFGIPIPHTGTCPTTRIGSEWRWAASSPTTF